MGPPANIQLQILIEAEAGCVPPSVLYSVCECYMDKPIDTRAIQCGQSVYVRHDMHPKFRPALPYPACRKVATITCLAYRNGRSYSGQCHILLHGTIVELRALARERCTKL